MIAVDFQFEEEPAGHKFNDTGLKEWMDIVKDTMVHWPAALMAELLTFSTFRQAGYFKTKSLENGEKKGSAVALEELYVYLSKQKDGDRAASLRALNEKVGSPYR